MIFKTWLKDLSNVQGVINQLNNLGTGASITQMATAVSGLSKEQAILALSSRKLTEDQMKQVLVEAKLLESTVSLTTAQATERLSKSLNSEADAKALLQKYALITHQKLEKNSTLEVTAAKLQEAVANGTLSATEATAIANAYGLTIANGAQTASWKLLTSAIWQNVKAMGVWLVSNPLGWLTLAVGAIAGLTAGFVYLSKSAERAKDKLEESAEAFSQAKSEVENLNSELQTTKQRIDELSAKENLTLVETEELDKLKETNKELERELRLRESIALEKGKQANEDAIDYFGSQSTYGTTAGNIDISGDQLEILDFQLEKIKELEEYFKTADAENKDFLFIQNEKLLSFLKEETARTIEEFMELDDSLMEGYDEGYLDRLDKLYQKYDEIANGVAQSHTNTITGVLEKVDFKDNKEQLIELGKNGSLSVETLTSKFPALIGYLENAGISAQELYQYIMALANPDAVKYDELKHQLQEAMGFGSGINTLWAVDIDKRLQDLGLYDEGALEVFATIKAKYVNGETESWTPEDWIANIQEGLESLSQNPDEITDLGISEMVGEINTKLKPAMDSLSDAWNDIFTEDGFTLENVDVSMLDSIKSTVDDLNEMEGISIDYSSFEELAKVLTNTESTATDVENSMDEFATAILNGVSSTKELDSSTAQMVATLLESIGVSNAQEIVFAKLNAQTEALALQEQFATQHGIELANASNDIVAGFLNQAGATETARMYLFQLVSAEQIFNNQDLNTAEKIAELKELATAYGQTAIAARIANLEKASADGHIPIDYEKELNALQADINNAVNNVKVDFTPITKASGKAGKDAAEEYKKALEKELSDLDSVIGHIGDIIGDQIDLFNEQKDAAVDALEAQKKAAEEALEAEKDLVQAQIDAIQAKIDAKQKEIDAINEASEERKREIELQKAQFDLLRQQNQKTVLLYKDGQMQYDTDLFGIRDARESVTQAKESIKIAGIEKEISTLETEIKGLEDVIQSLDEKIEASNEYYDSLIESTEKYWDGLIKGLEDYKSRWDELKEIEERAEMEVLFKKLGISTEEVLSMSDSAFQSFKDHYLGLLTEIHSGNDEMVSSLKEVAECTDFAPLDKSLQTTKENIDKLSKTDLSNVNTSLSNTASSADTLNTNTEGVSENLTGISNSLNTIPEASKVDDLATAFSNLATAVQDVANALGIGADASIEGLVDSLQKISELSLGDTDEELGIISQFNNLKSAVDEVTNAISGGGSSSASSGGSTNVGGGIAKAGLNGGNAESGSADSLTGAIEEMARKAEESLGNGGEDSEEGTGTIGKFNALKTAVTDVINAIGTEANATSSEEGAENLISAIQLQYDKATEILPLEKLLFEELLTTIDKCVVSLNKMVSAFNSIAELGGMPTLPNGGGHSRGYAEGTVGKAFANGTGGYNGLPHDEKNALRSEYGQPELTVYPDGTTELTTEPTMSDLPKDTVIFNEEQTKQIMNNKGTVLGNAYAEGTVLQKVELPSYLRPLQEGDKSYDLTQKFLAHQDKLINQIIPPVTAIERSMELMKRNINNINTNNVAKPSLTINGGINVTCPGVNSKEVMSQVSTALQKEFGGMALEAYQRASITR